MKKTITFSIMLLAGCSKPSTVPSYVDLHPDIPRAITREAEFPVDPNDPTVVRQVRPGMWRGPIDKVKNHPFNFKGYGVVDGTDLGIHQLLWGLELPDGRIANGQTLGELLLAWGCCEGLFITHYGLGWRFEDFSPNEDQVEIIDGILYVGRKEKVIMVWNKEHTEKIPLTSWVWDLRAGDNP